MSRDEFPSSGSFGSHRDAGQVHRQCHHVTGMLRDHITQGERWGESIQKHFAGEES